MKKIINESEEGEQLQRRIAELQSNYRLVLLDTYEGEGCLFGPTINPPDRLLVEASALYAVTYRAAGGRQAAAARLAPPAAGHVGASSEGHALAAAPQAGSGLSFAWAVAGDLLEHIKCCATHLEECERRGTHTAPKLYSTKSLRLLLSRR